MRAGYRVVGYDVLAGRVKIIGRAGGQVAAELPRGRAAADVVICSLPSSAALLETAGEIWRSITRGRIVVETSTLPIAVKEEARRVLAASGACCSIVR